MVTEEKLDLVVGSSMQCVAPLPWSTSMGLTVVKGPVHQPNKFRSYAHVEVW